MMVRSKLPEPVTAYSYIRFSSKRQMDGDSLRRQTESTQRYCAARGWTLDQRLNLRDLGVSAFRGLNAAFGNLGVFLEKIADGTVRPGSVLVVESFDRISRQGIDEGYDLVKRILKSGVEIVTLNPERRFDVSATKSLSKGALEIQLILERAAEESERKSERLRAVWAEKKAAARAGRPQPPRRADGRVCAGMSSNVPRWLRESPRTGAVEPIPERVRTVKRIFALAAAGYGLVSIAKRLAADGIAPFDGARTWTRSYLSLVLSDRRVLGELQPRVRDADGRRVADGQVIRDYYPAVVEPDEFNAAAAGRRQRAKRPGRIGKHVNVFAGLLKSATDGGPLCLTNWTNTNGGRSFVLVPFRAMEGLARSVSFPYFTFERGLLALLAEIEPAAVTGGGDADRAADADVAALSGELAVVERDLAAVNVDLGANGYSATLAAHARALESRRDDLQRRLADAEALAATPASKALDDLRTLAGVLADADADGTGDDCRLRIRAALRRIVTDARALFAKRGRDRLAAVQLWFGPDRFRIYHCLHRPPANGRDESPTRWWATSFADEPDAGDDVLPPTVDFRDANQLDAVRTSLLAYDPAAAQDDWTGPDTVYGEFA